MSTVILACSTLQEYVDAAQKKMQTAYPVVLLDKKYHTEPRDMRQQVIQAMEAMEPGVDTVLTAMGFCGGSWADLRFDKRIVIPRVDDCVTILLHTDDTWCPNKKEVGHLYAVSEEPSGFSTTLMYENLLKRYSRQEADLLFDLWFHNYSSLDIVDTGLFDCRRAQYVERMRKDADFIHCTLDYVKGSNHLLEKLVSGNWDRQFLVFEAGQLISQGDFFDESEGGGPLRFSAGAV